MKKNELLMFFANIIQKKEICYYVMLEKNIEVFSVDGNIGYCVGNGFTYSTVIKNQEANLFNFY